MFFIIKMTVNSVNVWDFWGRYNFQQHRTISFDRYKSNACKTINITTILGSPCHMGRELSLASLFCELTYGAKFLKHDS